MSEHTNETENALIEAFLASTHCPPPEPEYRFYYDAEGKGTLKTTEDLPGQYLVITREEYDAIAAAFQWRRKGARISLIPLEIDLPLVLLLADEGYETIKDNMIFRVDDAYLGDTDHWKVRDTNDE